MKVAVVGSGVSGLVAAYVAAEGGSEVVLYEKEDYLGGHSKTVTINGTSLDLGFMVFNRVTYPNMMELFESLGVEMELSDMSFSVSLDDGKGYEWGSRNGFSSLFAQKSNLLSPYFFKMISEIIKFKNDALNYLDKLDENPDIECNETLRDFIQSRGYSELFQKAYLIPICGSIWSCSSSSVMSFSAYSTLSFCRNHHLLQLFGRPQWLTVKWRSREYVNKVRQVLENRGCQVRTSSQVCSVSSKEEGCVISFKDGSKEKYDGCIIAAHAPDALEMLGDDATFDERKILGAFQYAYSDIYLHRDKNLMPRHVAAWSSWNFLGTVNDKVCVTYWLNLLQNINNESELPFLVTLNPTSTPQHTLLKWTTGHPIPSVAATKASSQLSLIQGKRRIWFCGAYQGYGFHEDGLKAAMLAANGLLKKTCTLKNNPKHMVPSWLETGARLLVIRFLERYIATGSIILLENGGTMFTFEGASKRSSLKVSLRIHSPQFYWKVAKEADLGFADAYINGDFSLVDENEGLLNLCMILIANSDLSINTSKLSSKRVWRTPLLLTSAIASTKYFFRHLLRRDSATQARRNISRPYGLGNQIYSLFLDDTMTYSCAIFKAEDEDLKTAQLRKVGLLIKKARIRKHHHILEIGFGWGTLAMEVVKRTGCKYTGITVSEQQLQYAELKVKEAGLQDGIEFRRCDYRQLDNMEKYDRIIACEMLEAVGHEQMEEFFWCCDNVLAQDGILVVQFVSVPDWRYDEARQSSDFTKEYIFPGETVPSLSRVMSAMAHASTLCVQHVEDIGIYYYQTQRCWRHNFLDNQSKILDLGFHHNFIRAWEYHFDYCAAGFKTSSLGVYQVVFIRPGNVEAFGHPYDQLNL